MKSAFNKESFFPVSKRELFEFHERPDAFGLLTPPSSNVEVQSTASTLAPSDDVVRYVVRFLFFRFAFENIHTEYEPHDMFADEQRRGLFKSWRHEHRFFEGGWGRFTASRMQDRIEMGHPLLPLFVPFVKQRLKGMFRYRHGITADEVTKRPEMTNEGEQLHVVVTGATGLIGRRLVEVLREHDVRVTVLVRDPARARELFGDAVACAEWDFTRPEQGDWKTALEGVDSVVHLAGTPLFQKRWSEAFKREMERSRVLGTRQLVEAIAELEDKPESFVSASALGIYGTDATKNVDEESPAADDLLARICVNWEREAVKLEELGVRTTLVRIGIVLSTESGALKEMLPVFKLGLGGPMGYPDHYINWIHLEDIVRVFAMAIENTEVRGPLNGVAPNPVTMRELAKGIGRVLGRPAIMKYPVALMKLMIGEAGEYSSGGPRASGDKLEGLGYRFFFEQLEPALVNLLKG
ncbi:MAG: TIGR01777 family oxidoreductase [Deltaproteobacteria bacterium]|nr:TIGR01777 family oxidoreductase [Deltaproteobacteria bacterium]